MSEHTPVPWNAEPVWAHVGRNKDGVPAYEDRFAIIHYGDSPSTIAITEGGYGPGVEKANADFIVRSVNAHNDFVAEIAHLKALVAELKTELAERVAACRKLKGVCVSCGMRKAEWPFTTCSVCE